MHWAVALLVVSMLAAGSLMIRSLEPWQPSLLMLHKSTGLLVFLLVLVRLLLRFSLRLPAPPAGSRWQLLAASATHAALYLLLLVIPLTGLFMQYFAAKPISVYGLWSLPAALVSDIERFAILRELHGILTLLLMVLITLHIGAALYHQCVKKDQLLRRMW
jgi:cytochrome b561